jgi:hypothetical protein
MTLIVGAGPAGLAVALALRCHGADGNLQVVDPAGRWMAAWHQRFASQDIACLRSPAVHHPHPDAFALLAAGHEGLVHSGGTHLPTTDRFRSFCDDLVTGAGLDRAVETATAVRLAVDDDGSPEVTLADGEVRRPHRVVLATNARRGVVPPAFRPFIDDPRVSHGDRADVRRTPPGGRVLVVGGGLSAAHLALGAARRGAQVTLVSRRRLAVRRFDVHPTWLGPRKRRPFEREPDPVARRRAVDRARGGGSIPARVRRELDACVAAGTMRILERSEITSVVATPDHLAVDVGERTLEVDIAWLATGGRIDVAHDPMCSDLVAREATTIVDGLPELDADLSWPGTRVHLAGFAAALRLGPTAGNLVGHRRAAQRVLAGVLGADPDRADRVATGAGACPQDERPRGDPREATAGSGRKAGPR